MRVRGCRGARRDAKGTFYDGCVPDPRLSALTRLRNAVQHPTPSALRRLAAASIVLNVVIVLSGATVRLTESGLGCPSWPRCTGASLLPAPGAGHSMFHMVIEFGNRLIALPVLAAGLACLVAAARLRSDRRDLTALAFLQVLGIVTQAVVGGVSVYTTLSPVPVATHFLLSVGVLAAAVALYFRAGEGNGRPRHLVSARLRALVQALVAAALLVLVLGTVVTGSGPHAGDAEAQRLPFSIPTVARLHSGAVWLTLALTIVLLVALRVTAAPEQVRRRTHQLLILVMAQGAVGYIQYFAGIPAPLVAVHILGAVLFWIATLRVYFATRDRGPAATPAGDPLAGNLAETSH